MGDAVPFSSPGSQKRCLEGEVLLGLELSRLLAAAFPARIPIKGFKLPPSFRAQSLALLFFHRRLRSREFAGLGFGGEPRKNSPRVRDLSAPVRTRVRGGRCIPRESLAGCANCGVPALPGATGMSQVLPSG